VSISRRSLCGALCASLLLAAGTTTALAHSPRALFGQRLAMRGVLRAEAAGIKIDLAAKRIMAAAPLGSCLNDPTLRKCARYRPRAIHVYGWRSHGASAASIYDQCQVNTQHLGHVTSIGGAYGQAQAEGSNWCSSAVTVQELFVTIESYWLSTSSWHVENTYYSGEKAGGQTIKGWANFNCKSNATRAWENLSQGYADLKGVWYAGQDTDYTNLPCQG
jgi:hypothetical protein